MTKKKILFLFQYFRHPGEPGGTRIYWISRELVKSGYQVTIITQKNSFNPENKNAPRFERTNLEGIDIVYIKNPYSNEFSYLKRVYVFCRFMIKSTWYALKEEDVSMVIATSTPLSIGVPALAMKIFRKVPFVFEIRDLWPEVPIQMGVLKNPLLIKIFRWFEHLLYIKSEHVVAASPGMADEVMKIVHSTKVTVISNMSKIKKFYPREKNVFMAESLGLEVASFKTIHFGTMGVANGLNVLVSAALCAHQRGIYDLEFIMVGSGKMKKPFRDAVSKNGLKNLHIFDRMPMDTISELVNICDVSFIGFSPIPILETNSANKFFDSLSAGKPILINFGGWMQEIIEKERCGIRVNSTDPIDLLDKIMFLKENSEIRSEMANNSRRLAEERFDESILCPKYVDLIDNIFSKMVKED